MLVNRLHVRGKMNLLILLPLTALIAVAVPFVLNQVNSARSAGATADAARTAQALSDLVFQLQRERLLTAGYLASPSDDGTALRRQHDAATTAARTVQATLGAGISDELAGALTRVGSLSELRDAALHRGTSLDSVARAYHAVIQALIDALRLVPQRTTDAEGTRQLVALDALLNANEQSALRGMALIVAAVSPQSGTSLLTDASSRAEQFVESFVEQADVDEADQVVQVELGEAARQVNAVAQRLPGVRGSPAISAYATQALAAVDALGELRRAVQERVTGEIAENAAGRADGARNTAALVGIGVGVLFVLVAALTVTLSRSIARPLRRLTRAASDVADLAGTELARVGDAEDVQQEQPPRLAEIETTSADEVGELARAFNRVQSTAAALVERQIVSRRNVNLMFTNVAQRTRNLVSRQLSVVDELERDEENAPLLARLYHLDHLATRLRRTAENLLVLAGSQEEPRIKRPTSLATLVRAALTEIEDYRRVRLQAVADVVVSATVASDLMLIFAELLENATSFSPPESTVEVVADVSAEDGYCRVVIVDRGIGMTPQRLSEENQRLVERERLEIAPTNVLGLFVVGRLSRRHGLTVRLRPTMGGGTTVDIAIPPGLFQYGGASSLRESAMAPGLAGVAGPAGPHGRASVHRLTATAGPYGTVGMPIEAGRHVATLRALPAGDGGFDWFSPQAIEASPAVQVLDRPPSPIDPMPSAIGPLPAAPMGPAASPPIGSMPSPRRPADGPLWSSPGHSGTAAVTPPWPPVGPTGGSAPDHRSWPGPAAPMSGPSMPSAAMPPPGGSPPTPAPPGGTPSGLTRRVPGAQLAPGLRDRDRTAGRPERTWQTRDPDGVRAAFDDYADAWTRAGSTDPLKERYP